jgi:hypothetical protein
VQITCNELHWISGWICTPGLYEKILKSGIITSARVAHVGPFRPQASSNIVSHFLLGLPESQQTSWPESASELYRPHKIKLLEANLQNTAKPVKLLKSTFIQNLLIV